jgi:hypothetical protein
MTTPPAVTTSFDEGRYFDLWMFVHFISGVAGGFSNVFWELPTAMMYALAVFLMLLWETGEFLARIRESWSNRVIDLVVGIAGVILAERLSRVMLPSREIVAFVACTALALGGLALGVRAYRRRAATAPR